MAEDNKHKRHDVERSSQLRRDTVTDKPDLQLGLYDIDETIKYYFDKVVKLQIPNSSGILVPVPAMYASPENWKSFQSNTLSRDSRGKIQLPILTFKRDSISKNRDLGNKVDPNAPIYALIDRGRDPNDRTDRLGRMNKSQIGRRDRRVLEKVIVPDYVIVTYSCIIYTEFLTQMNTLIEAISYGEGGYWGDKGKYMVRAKIDEFPTTVEVEIGTDRIVKTEFQITVNGHIIPKNIQQSAAQGSTKAITGTKVVIGESIVKNINSVDDNLDSSIINT
tara:strand:+ start:1668 stop:2498 length:831 start_codon:yes stop_codon:yes gene_type:complete